MPGTVTIDDLALPSRPPSAFARHDSPFVAPPLVDTDIEVSSGHASSSAHGRQQPQQPPQQQAQQQQRPQSPPPLQARPSSATSIAGSTSTTHAAFMPPSVSPTKWAANRQDAIRRGEMLRQAKNDPPPLRGGQYRSSACALTPVNGSLSSSTPALMTASATQPNLMPARRTALSSSGGPSAFAAAHANNTGTTPMSTTPSLCPSRPASAASRRSLASSSRPSSAASWKADSGQHHQLSLVCEASSENYYGSAASQIHHHAAGGSGRPGSPPTAPPTADTLEAELRNTEHFVGSVHKQLISERIQSAEERSRSYAKLQGAKDEAGMAYKKAREWEARAAAAEARLQLIGEQDEAGMRRHGQRLATRLVAQRKTLETAIRKKGGVELAGGLLAVAEEKLSGSEATLALARLEAAEDHCVLLERTVDSLKAELDNQPAVREREVAEAMAKVRAEERVLANEAISKLEAEHAEELREAAAAIAMQQEGTVESLNAQLERERAEQRSLRIEDTKQRALRRLVHQGLSGAWGAWYELWEEKVRERRMMASVASRLRRPELARSFSHWREDYHEMERQLAASQLGSEAERRVKLEEEMGRLRKMLEAKVATLVHERDALQERLSKHSQGWSSQQAELEAQLAKEKEERVQQVAQMSVKRLFQQGMARGWTAWKEGYLARRHQQNLMRQAGGRLMRPQLSAALSHWRRDWEAEERAKLAMSLEGQLKEEAARRAAAEEALREARAELEKVAKESSRRSGLGEEGQKRAEAELEREREARVQQVATLFVRRIKQQGLSRGWMAWAGAYLEKRHQQNMMRQAASRMMKPQLSAAFGHWRSDWQAEERAKLAMSLEGQLKEEAARRDVAERALRQTRAELNEARRAMLEGRGEEAERRRLLEEQLEKEKEERVQQVAQMGLRRLFQQGMARGWTAWKEGYLAHRHQQNLMRQAGGRLTRPQLSAALSHWRHSWELAEKAKVAMSHQERLSAEVAAREAVEAELAELKAVHERKIGKAEAERERMLAQIASLDGEAAKQVQREKDLEVEREARIERLREGAVKRLFRQGVGRAFNGWLEAVEEAMRTQRLIAWAGSRLAKPALSSAFHWWITLLELKTEAREKRANQSQLEAAEAAKDALSLELSRAKEEAALLSSKAASLKDVVAGQEQASVGSEVELKRALREREKFETQYKMEHVALLDERERSTRLQIELEEALLNSKQSRLKEEEASEARQKAERENAISKELLEGMQGVEGEGKTGYDERLARLLKEQREQLEEVARRAREENRDHIVRLRDDNDKLAERISMLEQRLRAANARARPLSPPRPTSPESPEQTKPPLPPATKFKEFTFTSQSRAEIRREKAEMKAKMEEEAKLRKILAKFNKGSTGSLSGLGGGGGGVNRFGSSRPPPDLTPELKKAWVEARNQVILEWAATKLQTAFRGVLARRKVTEKKGSGGGGGGSPRGGGGKRKGSSAGSKSPSPGSSPQSNRPLTVDPPSPP